METGTLRLVIFSFILSILFPMMAFTFTTFGAEPEAFDTTLSISQLQNAGIMLSGGESFNITFGDPAQEYTVKNTTMRIKWVDSLLFGDYFANQQQSFIERVLGTWFFPIEMNVVLDGSQGFIRSRDLTNATVIAHWDSQYNWTRYSIVENGLVGFITTIPGDYNNITAGILNGLVTVTIGAEIFDQNDPNPLNFANWYISVVSGTSDWGLPDFMVWIVRIFSFMTILAGYLLFTELIPG